MKCWFFFHCCHPVLRPPEERDHHGNRVYKYTKYGPSQPTRCRKVPTTRKSKHGYDEECCRCGKITFRECNLW